MPVGIYAESRRIGTIRPTCIKPMLYEVLNYKPLKKIKMQYYRQLLKNWQNILDAMDKIDKDNQSRYFYDFKKEVKNRVDEYKFLSEKEKTRFGNVPFPF